MRGLLLVGMLAAVLVALWPLLAGWRRSLPGLPAARRDELVKDPVCQTYVVRSRAVRRQAGGDVAYFCSEECAARHTRGARG